MILSSQLNRTIEVVRKTILMKNLMKSLHKGKINYLFPKSLIDDFPSFRSRTAVPCSVRLGDEEIGSLLLRLPEKDMVHFGLTTNSSPEPMLKFSMFNIEKMIYAIEIWLIFEGKEENLLKIHLDPKKRQVQELLYLIRKNKLIAFHLNGMKSSLIGSVLVSLNTEQMQWIRRNYTLSKKLPFEFGLFSNLSERLAKDMSSTDRLYKPDGAESTTYFASESADMVIFSRQVIFN